MPTFDGMSNRRVLTTRLIPLSAVLIFLWGILHLSGHGPAPPAILAFNKASPLQVLPVAGFANYHVPDDPDCGSIRIDSTLAVSQSHYLADDILEIAMSIEHPIIDYNEQQHTQSFVSKVRSTWSSMSGSSVWLDKYQVYMMVSRVFYYAKGNKAWSIMSFIRARIYDENWQELKNHTIRWRGEDFTFPRTLDIDAPWWPGDIFFGPEDPRIIIETDVEDAEPVVIFNMIGNLTERSRSMFAHHPFSNFTTKFHISYEEQVPAEKNWAPFFLPDQHATQTKHRYASDHIHFVYDWSPLQILRCHLLNGGCLWLYKQPRPESYLKTHDYGDTNGAMRGGTNFVPVPSSIQPRAGLHSFVGLPRTHCDAGCGKTSTYRPELAVLTTDGTTFWLDYMSEALDFNTTILTPAMAKDVCDTGAIMMANSITRMYPDTRGKNKDVMEVTYSVADSTVQVGKIQGVGQMISNLPQFREGGFGASWQPENVRWNANVTHEVLQCSVLSAADYAKARAPPGKDLEKDE